MNVHKSRKLRKGECLTAYPLGAIKAPSGFCDILNEKYGHVCCVISIPSLDGEEKEFVSCKGEFVAWDEDGFPDIYVKDRRIGLRAMKKGIKMLERDQKNRFRYKLIKKNFLEVV